MRILWKLALPALLFSLSAAANPLPPIKTVFLILMENWPWSMIEGNTNAPYINNVLLPQASYCEQYFTAPYLNPPGGPLYSLTAYIWLEAGTNFNIWDDNSPDADHQNTTNHLVSLLKNAGVTWKTYQEDITGDHVPLDYSYEYAPRHNPFVYFDDVTGTNNPADVYGIKHNRPYTELATDLASNHVAQYNFITPNLCHDMHGDYACPTNTIQNGDAWLASEIPKLLASSAYTNHGAIFITWDDGGVLGVPVGMMVLSPLAKGGGYRSYLPLSHSSTLRTMQEIFGVYPWLGDAANATDLSDLFVLFGFSGIGRLPSGAIELRAIGVCPGSTNLVQVSADLVHWDTFSTNCVSSNTFSTVDAAAWNFRSRFYRLVQVP